MSVISSLESLEYFILLNSCIILTNIIAWITLKSSCFQNPNYLLHGWIVVKGFYSRFYSFPDYARQSLVVGNGGNSWILGFPGRIWWYGCWYVVCLRVRSKACAFVWFAVLLKLGVCRFSWVSGCRWVGWYELCGNVWNVPSFPHGIASAWNPLVAVLDLIGIK